MDEKSKELLKTLYSYAASEQFSNSAFPYDAIISLLNAESPECNEAHLLDKYKYSVGVLNCAFEKMRSLDTSSVKQLLNETMGLTVSSLEDYPMAFIKNCNNFGYIYNMRKYQFPIRTPFNT